MRRYIMVTPPNSCLLLCRNSRFSLLSTKVASGLGGELHSITATLKLTDCDYRKSAYTSSENLIFLCRHLAESSPLQPRLPEPRGGMAFTSTLPLVIKGVIAIISIAVARFLYLGYVHRTKVRSLEAQGIVSAVSCQCGVLSA